MLNFFQTIMYGGNNQAELSTKEYKRLKWLPEMSNHIANVESSLKEIHYLTPDCFSALNGRQYNACSKSDRTLLKEQLINIEKSINFIVDHFDVSEIDVGISNAERRLMRYHQQATNKMVETSGSLANQFSRAMRYEWDTFVNRIGQNFTMELLKKQEEINTLLRENAELRLEIKILTAPPPWSVDYWNRTQGNLYPQNTAGYQPPTYTICIFYAADIVPQLKGVIDDMMQSLRKELEPVVQKGYAIFNFVHYTNVSQQDKLHAAILASKLASNRVRISDRQLYGNLNAQFGGDEGQPERRHVVLFSAAQPTNQVIVPLDDNNEMEGIPNDQLIKENMSTLFMSGMKEKQLASCEINQAVIEEMSKWIMRVVPKRSA